MQARTFRDVGHLLGVNRLNQAGGGIMDDFDNDGLLDIVTTTFDPTGSMTFYLWEPLGITPTEIVNRLIDIALEVHANKAKRIFSYEVGLLDKAAAGGVKLGLKGHTPVANTNG